jgi:hypothetical protein
MQLTSLSARESLIKSKENIRNSYLYVEIYYFLYIFIFFVFIWLCAQFFKFSPNRRATDRLGGSSPIENSVSIALASYNQGKQ